MDIDLQTRFEDDPNDEWHNQDIHESFIKHFNDVHQELVKRNPTGWEDEFESRLPHLVQEAGRRQGTHVETEPTDSGFMISVYSPYAARTLGKLPMSHRTPKEIEKTKEQEHLSHMQFHEAVTERLGRAAKRMHEAGLHGDLFSEGSFTVDPDAEDPRDIYRPK